MTGKRPAAQFGLTYDDPLGWYAGAFGSTVRLVPPAGWGVQGQAFAGYAMRLASGVSVEAGGAHSWFADASRFNYTDLYAGASTENMSARLHYSPRYYGQSANAWYGELNYAIPLIDSFRLFSHAGYLYTSGNSFYGSGSDRRVVDVQIGLSADFDQFHVELSWVGINRAYVGYRLTRSYSPNTALFTVSRAF